MSLKIQSPCAVSSIVCYSGFYVGIHRFCRFRRVVSGVGVLEYAVDCRQNGDQGPGCLSARPEGATARVPGPPRFDGNQREARQGRAMHIHP